MEKRRKGTGGTGQARRSHLSGQERKRHLEDYLTRLGQLAKTPSVLELPAQSVQPEFCEDGSEFSKWTEKLCTDAIENASTVSINQAKVLLVDNYMERRKSVPKRHSTYVGSAHTCIFHVFEAAYERLRAAELSLVPPMLFVPTPPASPVAPQIAGIFIGEMEGK